MMPAASRHAARLVFICAAVLTCARAIAGPYDPRLQFKTLLTPHFAIHFHQNEEDAARRLGVIAESVRARLATALGHTPAGRTEVVLVQQSDVSNGQTTVVPWNAIEIDTTPPGGAELLGNSDDWLAYVFTHEYAHVLHLDRSRGWARIARGLFGRSDWSFPNLTLPEWQIEGFATLVESHDGQGRLNAGDFREIVDAGVRAGRVEPIDRVSGGLVDWPAGDGWYAYGARFQEFLVERFGADKLVALSDRTAGRLPFLTAGAFDAVYGQSLGDLWDEFEGSLRAPAAGSPPGQRLTHTGYLVGAPRTDDEGGVWYSANDGRRFPGLYRLRPGAATPSRETSRYGGAGLTVGHGIAIFDQLELSRGAGLESDLYALDTKSGRVRRLTRGARVVDPDLSPDGRRLAVSRTGPGFRELLVLDADALLRGGTSQPPVVLARTGGPSDVYVSPRWSPDGRCLAVEHRRVGGRSEIVVVDDQLRDVSATITSSSGRNVTPEWAGDDALYFSSDRDGGTFAIWKAVLATNEITRVIAPPGGALAPARLRDQLVYLGYTADGYDLFTASPDGERPAPLESGAPAIDRGLLPHLPSLADGAAATPAAVPSSAATPYRPWGTFAPRGWLPVVEQRDNRWWLGGSVQAIDVLARHAAWVTASWAVAGDHPASNLVSGGRPDWSAGYQYARWQLSPYVIVQDQVSLFEAVDQTGSLFPVAQREQQVDAGALRTVSHIRWVQQVSAAYHASRVTTTVAAGDDEVRRSGLRASWTLGTARRFAYSISQERGVQIGATAETFRPALGADGAANAFTGDVRVFAPIGIRQGVLAARLAAGWSSGDVGIRRVFRMGGNNGDAAIGAFGNQTISLLRGFDSGVFAGTRVALANLEARLPLAWPQRGWDTWPLFLKSLHATAFADAGDAWSTGGSWSEVKTSVGAELSTDVVAGFGLPLTWTVGAAWGHDGAGLLPDQHRVYVRVGRAF